MVYRNHYPPSLGTSFTGKPSGCATPISRSVEALLDWEVIMANNRKGRAPQHTPHPDNNQPHSAPQIGIRTRSSIAPQTRNRLMQNEGPHSTPRRVGAFASTGDHSSGAALRADDKEANRKVFDEWAPFHTAFDSTADGDIEKFLEAYVPCSAPYDKPKDSIKSEALNVPIEGKEFLTYIPLVLLLTKCQTNFDDSKKIYFEDSHSNKLEPPTEHDHPTAPDILGGYPGMGKPSDDAGWDQYALAIEVKTGHDPVDPESKTVNPSEYNREAIAQLVKCARSLLYFSSRNYVFVIGVYSQSRKMRIYRFDRSGSVSCGFDYLEKPHMIREFLWRLVHPLHGIPNTVVGWDETIRIPSAIDITNMQQHVERFDPEVVLNRDNCRWVKVRLNHDSPLLSKKLNAKSTGPTSSASSADSATSSAEMLKYYDIMGLTFGDPLYKSSGLYSRATYVTRILVNVPGQGYVELVLKDAWHQKVRTPEALYYERIQDRYPELRKSRQFAWVKKMYPKIKKDPNYIPGLADYHGHLYLSELDSDFGTNDQRGHITVTRRRLGKPEDSERVRARTLVGPVGRPLSEYTSTRGFAVAIRDAIVGHFIARACGVLHRDISCGNVLIVKDSATAQGFLHDFDYASFVPCLFGLDKPEDQAILDVQPNPHKELTGTQQFMAIDVLGGKDHYDHHDLESFYWVMIWVLLRHTFHTHEDKEEACTLLFDNPDNRRAKRMKREWVNSLDEEPFGVENNPPLTELVAKLRAIIRRPFSASVDKQYPKHEELAALLHKMIKSSGWPHQNDGPRPYPWISTAEEPLDHSKQIHTPPQAAGPSNQIPAQNPPGPSNLPADMEVDDGAAAEAEVEAAQALPQQTAAPRRSPRNARPSVASLLRTVASSAHRTSRSLKRSSTMAEIEDKAPTSRKRRKS